MKKSKNNLDENIIIAANKEDFDKKDISEATSFENELIKEEQIESAISNNRDETPLDDNIKLYMKDVAAQQRLSSQQELELLKIKQKAQEILTKKNISISLPVSKEDIKKIKKETEKNAIRQGEIASERLVECNLRLVISVAKHYHDNGVPILDLIQEGNVGLMKGVEKFDTSKGCKLSTYITWWIRHYIAKYLTDHSRNIRIPANVIQQILKMNKLKAEYYNKNNKEISVKQLAKELNIPESRVEDLLLIPLNTASIDATVGNGDDTDVETTVGDLIADTSSFSQDDFVEVESLRTILRGLINQLSPKEQQIIKLRYGFDDDNVRSVEEVCDILNIQKRRVVQLEDKALRKLKNFAKDAGLNPELFSF